MAGGQRYTGLTPEKRERFLELVTKGNTIAHAARAVRVSRQTLYEHRKDEPDFAAAWAAAWDEGTEALEQEAKRRAVDGWLEPVYYQGEKVGEVRKRSDVLLIFMLKARKPETYRDNVKHELSGPEGAPVSFTLKLAPDGARDE